MPRTTVRVVCGCDGGDRDLRARPGRWSGSTCRRWAGRRRTRSRCGTQAPGDCVITAARGDRAAARGPLAAAAEPRPGDAVGPAAFSPRAGALALARGPAAAVRAAPARRRAGRGASALSRLALAGALARSARAGRALSPCRLCAVPADVGAGAVARGRAACRLASGRRWRRPPGPARNRVVGRRTVCRIRAGRCAVGLAGGSGGRVDRAGRRCRRSAARRVREAACRGRPGVSRATACRRAGRRGRSATCAGVPLAGAGPSGPWPG